MREVEIRNGRFLFHNHICLMEWRKGFGAEDIPAVFKVLADGEQQAGEPLVLLDVITPTNNIRDPAKVQAMIDNKLIDICRYCSKVFIVTSPAWLAAFTIGTLTLFSADLKSITDKFNYKHITPSVDKALEKAGVPLHERIQFLAGARKAGYTIDPAQSVVRV